MLPEVRMSDELFRCYIFYVAFISLLQRFINDCRLFGVGTKSVAYSSCFACIYDIASTLVHLLAQALAFHWVGLLLLRCEVIHKLQYLLCLGTSSRLDMLQDHYHQRDDVLTYPPWTSSTDRFTFPGLPVLRVSPMIQRGLPLPHLSWEQVSSCTIYS